MATIISGCEVSGYLSRHVDWECFNQLTQALLLSFQGLELAGGAWCLQESWGCQPRAWVLSEASTIWTGWSMGRGWPQENWFYLALCSFSCKSSSSRISQGFQRKLRRGEKAPVASSWVIHLPYWEPWARWKMLSSTLISRMGRCFILSSPSNSITTGDLVPKGERPADLIIFISHVATSFASWPEGDTVLFEEWRTNLRCGHS